MIDISVSNLTKEFEVGKKILDGLSFQVDQGERVGLLQFASFFRPFYKKDSNLYRSFGGEFTIGIHVDFWLIQFFPVQWQ